MTDPNINTDHALSQWSARYFESMDGLKDVRVPLRLNNLVKDAGFVDVSYCSTLLKEERDLVG
jgi:hypothetical protein